MEGGEHDQEGLGWLSKRKGRISAFTIIGLLAFVYAAMQANIGNLQNAGMAALVGVGLIYAGTRD